jgi:hypothetical protein
VDKVLQDPIKGSNGAFAIYFVGCIDYAFSFVGGHHQTPFIYEFDKKIGSQALNFEHFGADDNVISPERLQVLTNPQTAGTLD